MKEINCNLCGSTYYKVIYDIKGQVTAESIPAYKITEDKADLVSLRVVRCLRCSLIYLNPQQDLKDMHLKYCNMEDDVYISEEQGRRIAAKIILNKIAKYRRKGKILDIGCATGLLLDEAKKQGWQAYGIELSRWAVNFAREKFNLDIYEGLLAEAKFPYNYFDAVVMIDVIEHLPNPKKTLEEIRRILKPDGMLCISTPDIDSFLSRLLAARWWGIQHSHLYYFSKKTLTNLLDATGFNVIKYTSHSRVFSLDYWKRRIKNHSPFIYGILNCISKYGD